jgi:hypothetical protein
MQFLLIYNVIAVDVYSVEEFRRIFENPKHEYVERFFEIPSLIVPIEILRRVKKNLKNTF